MSVPPITCHILDTTVGRPATGVLCELSYLSSPTAAAIATAHTNPDGRVKEWTLVDPSDASSAWITDSLKPGYYKVRFNTLNYFSNMDRETFFPYVDIVFQIPDTPDAHYHIPLLLSNYGYSTYRGS